MRPSADVDQADYDVLMGNHPQSNPDYDPSAIYASTLREEKLNNLLQQINPDNILSDIEHRIKGYRKDVYTNEWVKINPNTPEINEILISNFMSFLGSVLNQSTSMSNFSSGEINSIMELVVEFVADDLDANDERYGLVEQYQEMSRIGNIIAMSTFVVLKRAQNGMEARRIFSALKISEQLTQTPKEKGFKDALQFWK